MLQDFRQGKGIPYICMQYISFIISYTYMLKRHNSIPEGLFVYLLVIYIEDYLFLYRVNLEDIFLHAKLSYTLISMADVF